MCIAILNTKKAGRLPKSYIKNSWDNNDMGAGLLWASMGKLNTFKTYKYKDFLNKYNEIRDDKSVGNIVLHFRIATSGFKGEHNLHPFLVNDDLGFVHNGVISGLGNNKYSDTYEFNTMLQKFNHNFIECDMTKHFLCDYISSSKLVFLDSTDKYTILNEKFGHWEDDNWFSNNSYKSYNSYVWYGNTKVEKASSFKWDDEFDDETFSTDDEWVMYEYICDVYGLNPEDESSWDDVQYYMTLNNVDEIPDLYKILTFAY